MLDLTAYQKIVKIDKTSKSYLAAAGRAAALAPELKQVQLVEFDKVTCVGMYLAASASKPTNYNVAVWTSNNDIYAMCDCETYGQHYDGSRPCICKHIYSALADYKALMCEVCNIRPVTELSKLVPEGEQLCSNCRKVEQHMTSRSFYDKR